MTLKKKQIEEFKERLLLLKKKLTQVLSGTKQEVQETDDSKGYSQHQADKGTDDFGRIISLELSNNEKEILRHVERALEKIEEGTYGICDISEMPIPLKRLEAVPYANMTVEAQGRLEKGLV